MDKINPRASESSVEKPAMKARQRCLLFLIRSLGHGGAERQLSELVKGLDPKRFQVHVVTFYDGGGLRPEIEGLDHVKVHSLRKKSRWHILRPLIRLFAIVRSVRPEVLHGYMGNANELCLVLGALFRRRVVWGLRMSDRDLKFYDWLTRFTLHTGAWLSKFPDLIIVNSFAGRRDHKACGFKSKEMYVVHNGIDTDRFRPDKCAGRRLRQEWGIPETAFLIGMVGRLDPQKDHPTFLKAAAALSGSNSEVRFVCIGSGPPAYTLKLKELARGLDLIDRILWVPPMNDMVAVYNALDLSTLTSANGEGFANVVGESMACEVPVIVTDTGDCALIVGKRFQVVPAAQPSVLANAWTRIHAMSPIERSKLGAQQRERVRELFNVQQLVNNTVTALNFHDE